MTRSIRSLLACSSSLALLASMLEIDAAHGQTIPTPPVKQPVDENGVDLSRGTFNVTSADVSIGPPELGMTYVRSHNGAGWRDNLTGSLNFDGARMTVSIGDSSETFLFSSSVYTSDQGMGSTLVHNSATQEYIYTTSEGTVAVFAQASGTYGRFGNAGYLKSITQKNGTVWNFTNITGQWCPQESWNGSSCTASTTSAARVQSVTNTAGYQLKLEYASNTLTDFNSLDNWYRVAKVTGINNAVEYCDPAATSCAVASTWPKVTYAKAGSVETVTDSVGAQRTITYDASNRIVALKRPAAAAASTSATYDANGKVSAVTNEGVSFTYYWSDSATMRTLSRNGPLGSHLGVDSNIPTNAILNTRYGLHNGGTRTTSYIYDLNWRLNRIAQMEGNYVQYAYDARGNVTETRAVSKTAGSPADIVATAGYAASCSNPKTCNLPLWTRDAKGNQTDYTYDSTHGGPLTVTAPAPTVGSARPQTRYTYSPMQAYYRNSGGAIVASGVPIHVATQTSSCQTLASCIGTADESRLTIGYGPQQAGVANNLSPVSVTGGSGSGSLSVTSAVTYDAVGNLSTVDGPLAGAADTSRIVYDANRRRLGAISPDPDGGGSLPNLANRITYNLDGAITKVENGTTGGQTDAAWNALSPLERVETAYDANSRKVSDTFKGTDGVAVSLAQYSFDALGRPECTALRMNPAAFASLPSSACAVGIQGGFGPDRIAKTNYNTGDQVTSVVTGFGTSGQRTELTNNYTANGLVTAVLDANTNRTTYEYDGLDRLVKVRFPVSAVGADTSSATDYEQYSYDANGNVLTRRKRDGLTLTFNYDALNRVISKIVPERAGLSATHTRDVYYGYDLLGNGLFARFDSASGEGVSNVYDALGRNTSSMINMDGTSRTVTRTFDANGNRASVTPPSWPTMSYDYDGLSRLKTVRNGSSPPYRQYSFNADGTPSGYTTWATPISVTYSFDAARRLTSLNNDISGTMRDLTVTLGYNPASQIVSQTKGNDLYAWTGHANVDRDYTANGLNQFGTAGSATFLYDANGNLTSDGTTAFIYDVENRLVNVSGGNTATLRYDPLGRLYEVAGSALTTRFIYDGDELLAEYDSAGNFRHQYLHGNGSDDPIAWWEVVGQLDYRELLADQQGSIVAVTNIYGDYIQANRYDEYGIPQAGNAGRFQYTGQAWLPEVGMYYYKARMYSPTLGRFMQTDPIGYGDGMNWYNYVGGDPVNGVDPSGMCTASDGRSDGPSDCVVPIVVTGERNPYPCLACGPPTSWGVLDVLASMAYGNLGRVGGEAGNGGTDDNCSTTNAAIYAAKFTGLAADAVTVGAVAASLTPAAPVAVPLVAGANAVSRAASAVSLVLHVSKGAYWSAAGDLLGVFTSTGVNAAAKAVTKSAVGGESAEFLASLASGLKIEEGCGEPN